MIKNHLSSYGRLLLSFAMLFVVLLISGCCSFCDEEKFCPKVDCETCPKVDCETCPKVDCETCPEVDATPTCDCDADFVFTFNIPEKEEDCAGDTVFVDEVVAQNLGLKPHDGGAGVVERDGGAGVVERNGQTVTKFCLSKCPGNAYNHTVVPWLLLTESKSSGFLTAKTVCGG